MKTALFVSSVLAAMLLAGTANAADSGERTSMPAACAERDANCVIQDGAPRRRNPQQTQAPAPAGKSAEKGRPVNQGRDAPKSGDTSR